MVNFALLPIGTLGLSGEIHKCKGMTTDVYPRENCAGPDMCCIVYAETACCSLPRRLLAFDTPTDSNERNASKPQLWSSCSRFPPHATTAGNLVTATT